MSSHASHFDSSSLVQTDASFCQVRAVLLVSCQSATAASRRVCNSLGSVYLKLLSIGLSCRGHRLVNVRKLAFEQLTGRAFWDLVEKVHGLWTLVIGNVIAAKGHDVLGHC